MSQVIICLEAVRPVLNYRPAGFLMASQNDPVRGLILPEFMSGVGPVVELEWFSHEKISIAELLLRQNPRV